MVSDKKRRSRSKERSDFKDKDRDRNRERERRSKERGRSRDKERSDNQGSRDHRSRSKERRQEQRVSRRSRSKSKDKDVKPIKKGEIKSDLLKIEQKPLKDEKGFKLDNDKYHKEEKVTDKSVKDEMSMKDEKSDVKKKAEPLSLEELLAKKKAEEAAGSKPVFVTKEQRVAEALKRRQEEVAAIRASQSTTPRFGDVPVVQLLNKERRDREREDKFERRERERARFQQQREKDGGEKEKEKETSKRSEADLSLKDKEKEMEAIREVLSFFVILCLCYSTRFSFSEISGDYEKETTRTPIK